MSPSEIAADPGLSIKKKGVETLLSRLTKRVREADRKQVLVMSCPKPETLAAFRFGDIGPATLLQVESCRRCQAILDAAAASTDAEEQAFVSGLSSSRADVQARLAHKLQAANRKPHSLLVVAASIAVLIAGGAVWLLQKGAQGSSAQFYAEHRPFTCKFSEALHGAVTTTRGTGSSTEALLPLLDRQAELARSSATATTLAESAWIDAKLLRFEDALAKLRSPHSNRLRKNARF